VKWKQVGVRLPDIVVYGLHHPGLGLPYGGVEAFGFTVTLHIRRCPAYSAVRVHPDDGLPGLFVLVVCRVHGFSGARGDGDVETRGGRHEGRI